MILINTVNYEIILLGEINILNTGKYIVLPSFTDPGCMKTQHILSSIDLNCENSIKMIIFYYNKIKKETLKH